jgi:O-antigen/teichoic acid export membrane protein
MTDAVEEKASTRRILGRGASTSFLLQCAGVALTYATNVVFARSMGVEEFGVFTYVTNWARIGGTLSHLGTASSGLRFVAEHNAEDDWAKVHGVVRSTRWLSLLLGSAVATIGSVAVLSIQGHTPSSLAMVAALWIIPAAALTELQQTLIRAYKLIFRAFFPWLVLQPVLLIALALGAVVFDLDISATDAVLLTFASYLACVALQALWLHGAMPDAVRHAKPAYAYKSWATVTAPIFVSNVVYIVFSRMDVVMVGIIVGAKEAGIYAVAMRAGNLAQIGQTAMTATVAPRMSELYWSKREDDLQHLVHTAVRWVFIPTLVLAVLMSLLATPILAVFGHAFIAGRWVLIWIIAGQVVSVASGPVGWLMNLTGRQNQTAVVFGATAALTMIGYVVLIPTLGMVGAAIANSAAIAIRNLALSQLAKRSLGYNVSVWESLRPQRSVRS